MLLLPDTLSPATVPICYCLTDSLLSPPIPHLLLPICYYL